MRSPGSMGSGFLSVALIGLLSVWHRRGRERARPDAERELRFGRGIEGLIFGGTGRGGRYSARPGRLVWV